MEGAAPRRRSRAQRGSSCVAITRGGRTPPSSARRALTRHFRPLVGRYPTTLPPTQPTDCVRELPAHHPANQLPYLRPSAAFRFGCYAAIAGGPTPPTPRCPCPQPV